MNENKKKMYDLSGPKTVEAMKKRHFDAYLLFHRCRGRGEGAGADPKDGQCILGRCDDRGRAGAKAAAGAGGLYPHRPGYR